jgi:hypothetical protein
VGEAVEKSHDSIVLGLARIAAVVMFIYLFVMGLDLIHGQKLEHLVGGWGAWYLLEVALVVVPMIMLINGHRTGRVALVKAGAGFALLGILLNRLNISIIAFKWYAPAHYVPTWMEVVVTLAVISAELWVFRWIVNRMPVLGPKPAWAEPKAPEGREAAVPA